MKNTIFNTETNNTYIYSFNCKQTIISHPLIEYILEKENNNHSINEVLRSNNEITIYDKKYSKKELEYYYKKYLFLKKNNFFEKIDTKSILSENISSESIEDQLYNIRNITFEITERCNLFCDYCVYSDYYSTHNDRTQTDLNFKIAKNIIDFLLPKWIANKANFFQKIVIGFYGGEALLRFDIVKSIIEYTQIISLKTGLLFQYSMTTNGILLNKYIDEIVKNNIWLTISLDGNEKQNGYRRFKNDKPSFKIISQNIHSIKNNYPDYYANNVMFSTVLHDINDERDVMNFFNNEFDKRTTCNIIKKIGKKNDLLFEYKPKNTLNEFLSANNIDCFISTSHALGFFKFIKSYHGNIFHNLNEIYKFKLNKQKFFPTGVCFPFSMRLFVTAQGKILPCEKINFRMELGQISKSDVKIDTNLIAEKYHVYFEKIRKKCMICYNFIFCQSCLMSDIIQEDDSSKCEKFITYSEHSKLISYYWGFFEKHSDIYNRLMKEVSYE